MADKAISQNHCPDPKTFLSTRLCLFGVVTLGVMASVACTPTVSAPPAPPELNPVPLDGTVTVVTGQTLYVPVYSYIYMVDGQRTINLTTTLSIRNTSPEHAIILASVDYYNSRGELVSPYLESPVELGPLVSTEFVVPQEDITGGIGASFLVEWVATQADLPDPVIEAVMINTQGNQGLSFVSPGRVIEQVGP